MNECGRCGKSLKDVAAHMQRVHPEAFYMRPDEPPPHPRATRITLEDNSYTREGYEITWGEWHTERYGFRRHGWFIPVEVADNEIDAEG